MAKKKLTNNEKRLRRELELLRAQLKQSGDVNPVKAIINQVEEVVQTKVEKASRHELPITAIKKDLIKMTLFACFSLGLLVVLNVTKVTL